MNNTLIKQKSWWKRYWIWLVVLCAMLIISLSIFFTSGMHEVAADLAQAYADDTLYENALEQVKADERVIKVLGEIEEIDQLAILEGSVIYSNKNKTVNTSIRIVGLKGRGVMDVSANRQNEVWDYTKINIRIKSPPENKQTIVVLSSK